MTNQTQRKTLVEIASEWDAISIKRDQEIESGADISYHHVLIPAVMAFASDWAGLRVIDVGCGTGHLTRLLAAQGATVTGIDLSPRSIELAKAKVGRCEPAEFVNSSVEDYATRPQPLPFDVAIANMVLQAVPEIEPFLRAVRACLRPVGELIVTIPHPCFWPNYWGFETADWYEYDRELLIEAPLRTTRNPAGAGCITFFHRPLHRYLSALLSAGFQLADAKELTPSDEVAKLYPEPWKYPRFMAMKCTAFGTTGSSNVHGGV